MSNIQVNVNGEMITISWSSAESNGAEIIDYLVRILYDSQEEFSIALSTTNITLNRTALQSREERDMDVVYVVRVSARSEEGQGDESEQTFTLPAGMIVCVCIQLSVHKIYILSFSATSPDIRITGNRNVVEPGRPVRIECHSFGEFRGEVEWKQQTASNSTGI